MEEELVSRVQEGDREAFEELIVRHHRRLFVLAHGILRDAYAAEDATQQAFVAIWHDIAGLREPARFEAWSYRILVRVCQREARKRRVQADVVAPLASEPLSVPDPANSVVDRDRLERAFARLSVDQRTVVAMRYLLEMEPERIGRTLGIPRRTVYSRLRRGLSALRAALEADERTDRPRLGQREVAR